eukprot:m.18978 g.18978  ORF g.18978 m.18978 type:complete len:259 (-) comp10284_c0_seq1:44-820(-)
MPWWWCFLLGTAFAESISTRAGKIATRFAKEGHPLVVDDAHILSQAQRSAVRARLDQLRSSAHKPCCEEDCQAVEFVVYVDDKALRFTEGLDVARAVHDKLGVGQAQCDNGVVFYLNPSSHIFGISTGRGVMCSATDSKLLRLSKEALKPLLKAEKYGAAVVAVVNGIADMLDQTAPNNGLGCRWAKAARTAALWWGYLVCFLGGLGLLAGCRDGIVWVLFQWHWSASPPRYWLFAARKGGGFGGGSSFGGGGIGGSW